MPESKTALPPSVHPSGLVLCRETTKPNPDEDPGAGIMKMMQKMYDEGDDDMKRTIKKAWFESQEKRNKEGDAF